MEIIKLLYEHKIITSRGGFNGKFNEISLWVDRDITYIYDFILKETSYLSSGSMSERVYNIINNLNESVVCKTCTNFVKFNRFKLGYFDYCSKKCARNSSITKDKIKATNLQRYGCESPLQSEAIKLKVTETNFERYGVGNVFQLKETKEKSEYTKLKNYDDKFFTNREKAKLTNLERYGVENVSQIPDIKFKKIETNLRNYGVECIFQSEEIQNKSKETNLERYGYENPTKSDDWQLHRALMFDAKNNSNLILLRNGIWLCSELSIKSPKQIANEINCKVDSVHKWARFHNIEYKHMYYEQNDILQFLNSISDFTIEYDTRKIIPPKELDIYLPKYNLAIELNGIYWHRNDKSKHLNKLNLCNDSGIKLLQFWDYQWNEKSEICKSIIKNFLQLNDRVFARNCKIVSLSSSVYRKFMDDNHIHGHSGASIKVGLIYEDILVSVIGFGKPRNKYNKEKYDWELIRYANKLDTNVIGGFSKLFKYCNLNNIISYCDLMLFTGVMYEKSGFSKLKNSPPGYMYFDKNSVIKGREYFQKHKLPFVLSNYDPLLPSEINILNHGWNKIWNCGNGVWVFNK